MWSDVPFLVLQTVFVVGALSIELSQAAKERLIEVGFDPALGARPLRRAMQREIEDRLSESMLSGQLESGHHIKVDFVDGEFTFDNQPRGERISVGVNTGGEISATPEVTAFGE